MGPTLEEVLAQWRADAKVLDRAGHPEGAEVLERYQKQVEAAATDYLTWLSETDAQRKSGHGVPWLRSRFAAWELAGHAKLERGHRRYRAVAIPQQDVSPGAIAARAAGEERGRQ